MNTVNVMEDLLKLSSDLALKFTPFSGYDSLGSSAPSAPGSKGDNLACFMAGDIFRIEQVRVSYTKLDSSSPPSLLSRSHRINDKTWTKICILNDIDKAYVIDAPLRVYWNRDPCLVQSEQLEWNVGSYSFTSCSKVKNRTTYIIAESDTNS